MNDSYLGFSFGGSHLQVTLGLHDGKSTEENDFSIPLDVLLRLKRVGNEFSKTQRVQYKVNLLEFIGSSFAEANGSRCIQGYAWPFASTSDGELLIEFEEERLRPEELLSHRLLKWRQKMLKAFPNINLESVVVSLPSSAGFAQKKAIRQSFEIAGLAVTKFITNDTAFCLSGQVASNAPSSIKALSWTDWGFIEAGLYQTQKTVSSFARSIHHRITPAQAKLDVIAYMTQDIKKRFGMDVESQPKLIEKLVLAVEEKIGKQFSPNEFEIDIVQLGNKNRKEKPLHYRFRSNHLDLHNLFEETIVSLALRLAGMNMQDGHRKNALYFYGGLFERFLIKEALKRTKFRGNTLLAYDVTGLSKGAMVYGKRLFRSDEKSPHVELSHHPKKIVAVIQKERLVTLFQSEQKLPALHRQLVSMNTLNNTDLELELYETTPKHIDGKRLMCRYRISGVTGDREGEGLILLVITLDEGGLLHLKASKPLDGTSYLVTKTDCMGLSDEAVVEFKRTLQPLFGMAVQGTDNSSLI